VLFLDCALPFAWAHLIQIHASASLTLLFLGTNMGETLGRSDAKRLKTRCRGRELNPRREAFQDCNLPTLCD
jgi:hypothetical protein